MANQGHDLPLYEKVWLKRRLQRVIDTLILFLLLLLLNYRVLSSNSFTFPWFLALLCESWFTFTWIVILNSKWSPAVTITHPDRLLQWYDVCCSFDKSSFCEFDSLYIHMNTNSIPCYTSTS